jgi:hypothetical protein
MIAGVLHLKWKLEVLGGLARLSLPARDYHWGEENDSDLAIRSAAQTWPPLE